MKLRGGYNVNLSGRPSGEVEVVPEPTELCLPLRTRRFSFTDVAVAEGDRVSSGQPLATDPSNHSVPLLAPRAGTARLGIAEDHIVLQGLTKEPEKSYDPGEDAEHIPDDAGASGPTRRKLVALGAWEFVRDAHTGELPDPYATPRAAIVCVANLEPHVARGDVQILRSLSEFAEGLEQLQSVAGVEHIHLVTSDSSREIHERLRTYSWLNIVDIPPKYPFDNFAVLARRMGLMKADGGPVWGIGAAGVLAIHRALVLSRPCTSRIVSIGGPAIESPKHLKTTPGYPLKDILGPRAAGGETRAVCGGVLTGRLLGPKDLGLDPECEGITVLAEATKREFLGFVRPGLDRRSFSRNFLSLLRRAFPERLTTALRGERRPCVTCGFCEDVCPAGIMPHLIHKYLYKDDIDGAERARVDLCVGCGLCTFVCPSKVELRQQFADAKETIRQELHAGEEKA